MAQQNKLPEIEASFGKALKKFPEYKAEILEEAGKQSLQTVRGYIAESIHDTNHHIAYGQVCQLGSRRGYVATRAKTERGAGRNSVKPVTTFLNNGHIIRRSKKADGFYAGRHFYEMSEPVVKRKLNMFAKQLEEKMKHDIP